MDYKKNSLDIIRLVAAAGVVGTHLLAHLPPAGVLNNFLSWFNYYIYGVVIFFAISGFLVPASIERSKSKAEFMKKKIVRLYPSLWFAFLFSFTCIMVLYHPQLTLKRIIVWFGTQLTIGQAYTPGWLRGYGNGAPNGALWTIFVEMQMYLIAVLFYERLKAMKTRTWAIVISLSAGVNVVCGLLENRVPHIVYRLMYNSFVPYLYIFLMGMFLYFRRDTILKAMADRWWIVLVAYTVLIFALRITIPKIGFYSPIWSGLMLPIVALSAAYGLGNHRFRFDLSYGVFLFHMIFINICIQTGLTNWPLAPIIVVSGATVMAIVMHYVIEVPVKRLTR